MKQNIILSILIVFLFTNLVSAVFIDKNIYLYSSGTQSSITFDQNLTTNYIEINPSQIILNNNICFDGRQVQSIGSVSGVNKLITFWCQTNNAINALTTKFLGINIEAGSPEIFTFLIFILLSIAAGVFRAPTLGFMVILGLAGIMLYNFIVSDIFFLVILIGGSFAGYAISRMVRK